MIFLLTGATGFLGSNLLKMLLNKNHQVIVLKRSFSDLSRISDYLPMVTSYNLDEITSLEDVFKNHAIDCILHSATDYGRKTSDKTRPVYSNLIFPLQLIQLGKVHGVRAFINTDTMLEKSVSTYALAKKQFLEWMELYAKDMICINLALEHFYGPHDDKNKFLSYIIQSLLENVSEIPLTSGEQKRDFIYIDDVISAYILILENLFSYTAGSIYHFNVGSGSIISIKDVVLLIQKIIGNSTSLLAFGKIPYRENEVMLSSVDLSKINALGWKPNTTLFDGLQKTIMIEKN